MAIAIETHNLTKRYGQVHALNNLSVSVQVGVTTGLVGPNGAGKTTLFSLLAGFLQATSGDIRILGHAPNSPALRQRVSILPQDARFLKGIAVGKQLSMLAELQGLRRADARDEANRVLSAVNLAGKGKQVPEQLSHGMFKRIAIAQALIGKPELILLDEPTSGLDPQTARGILALIREMNNDCTFIISSHNLDVIEDLCQEILIISKGELQHQGEVANLTARTNVLSFKLESDPPEDIANIFSELPAIVKVQRGGLGTHSLVLHFKQEDGRNVEIEILQCLAGNGVNYLEMVRGERLAEKVTSMTDNK